MLGEDASLLALIYQETLMIGILPAQIEIINRMRFT